MTRADEVLIEQARQYGDELDTALAPGQQVRVRLFSGLSGSTALGRLVLDEDGGLVVEVHECQPAVQVRGFGGAA